VIRSSYRGWDATNRLAASCARALRAECRCDGADFHTATLSPEANSGDTLVLSCVVERGAGK
jgi:hypothetical protein